MSNLNEALDNYFANNSHDQVLEDWTKYEEYDDYGPKLSEFFNLKKILIKCIQ